MGTVLWRKKHDHHEAEVAAADKHAELLIARTNDVQQRSEDLVERLDAYARSLNTREYPASP